MPVERIEPGEGQESVWDYPRPPRVESCERHIVVIVEGQTIAETRRAKRVLETSHPPVYYIPREDVRAEYLILSPHSSFCEFKGAANYVIVTVGNRRIENAGWFYPDPSPAFRDIANAIAFYPSKMDACLVDGEKVTAQPGDFYGGWITSNIVGPFKGGKGTWGW